MVRADFNRSLKEIEADLLQLGGMVEGAIAKALESLRLRDQELARRVIEEDDLVDRRRWDLEERCLDLMATQQPFATDLRTLLTVLHVSVELERMGDYAEGIAKIALMLGDEPPLKPLVDIPRMAERAAIMTRQSLEALLERDAQLAEGVCNDDDEVDQLYDQVYRELLTYMIQDPGAIQRATFLLWVAHDLERIADRATNIAERVIFLITGRMTEINVSKY